MTHDSSVVLINPAVHDFAAYDLWAKPFGLLVIGEHLRRSGVRVTLIDATDPFHPLLEGLSAPKRKQFGTGKFYATEIPKPAVLADVPKRYRRYGLPPDRLEEAMRRAGTPDAVLVTCAMTYWYPGAFEAIALSRKIWPETPVLLGGVYATLCADHARENSGAHAVVVGPVENSIDLLKETAGIDIEPAAAGPLFRPALDLYHRLEYAPLMLSRGCPLRCAYCASGRLFDGFTLRDPAEVAEEILEATSRGILNFAFYDDALLWEPEAGLIPLLEAVLEKGLRVRFHAPNGLHMSRIDRPLAKMMKEAGFTTLRLGLESLSKARHDEWAIRPVQGGKVDPGKLQDVAESLWKAGYSHGEVGAYLLAGLADQSADELEEDIRTVISTGLRPYLAEYSPMPGTPMFENACKVSRYNLEEEPLTHNNSILPCARPEFTTEDLQRLKELTRPDHIQVALHGGKI